MNSFTVLYKNKVEAEVFSTAVLLSTHPLKLRVVYTPEKTIACVEIYWEDQQIEDVKETVREFLSLSPNNTITSLRCNVELPDVFEKGLVPASEKVETNEVTTSSTEANVVEIPKESVALLETDEEKHKEIITLSKVEEAPKDPTEPAKVEEAPKDPTEPVKVEEAPKDPTEPAKVEGAPRDPTEPAKVEEAPRDPTEPVKAEEMCKDSDTQESKEKVYTASEIDAILKGAYELLGYNTTAEQALKLAVGESLQTFLVEAKACNDKKLGLEKVPLAIVEVTNKFCKAEGIKIDSLLSLAISLSYIGAPSYADVYKAIAKIESKNVAMAKVEVTASFKRWIKQKHPAIAERYPDIEVKLLLNLFRDEECKF